MRGGNVVTTPRLHTATLSALALGFLALYLGWVIVPVVRQRFGIFSVYYTASRTMLYQPQAMPNVYDDEWFAVQIARVGIPNVRDIFNLNPPTMSLIALPLAWLPPFVARWAWVPISIFLLVAGLMTLISTLGLAPHWGVWVLPLVLLYAPITEELGLGQVYILLFALLCAVVWAEVRGRFVVAGCALGLMLILKTAGAWLALLLLVTGHWRTFLWAVGVAAVVALVSLPWIGVETWRTYFSQLPGLATNPARYVTAYQTTTSLLGHLFTYEARYNLAPLVNWPWLARSLSLIVVGLTLIFSMRWGRFKDQPVLTLALLSALIVTNAPLAEGYHYMLALPSLIIAWGWAIRVRPDWRAWLCLALATVLIGSPWPYKLPQLSVGAWALLAYPRVYGAFLLWGWLGWALKQARMV